ncbi:MAG TPA: CTP synthase, partial [Anaerolineae bacterium]|nr:CTP synthase [Anaerolineae bacterium]
LLKAYAANFGPDIIGLRADFPINEDIRRKISLFCDVEPRAVIPIVTASSIYEVPLQLEETGLADLVLARLGLTARILPPALDDWRAATEQLLREKPAVRIALVGKYVELQDAYISVREALTH